MSNTLTTAASISASVTAINPFPVASIIAFCGNEAPNGWLLCDGRSISNTNYPNLVAAIGDRVPDLRGRFIVGAGQGGGLQNYPLKSTGGAETVTLSLDQIPAHKHYGFGEAFDGWPMGATGTNKMGSRGGIDYDNQFYGTTDAGGGATHENRPPYFALNYIIKF